MKKINTNQLKKILAISTDKCFDSLNEFVTFDRNLLNEFILLKKKYKDGKNSHLLGKLSNENWNLLNTNISAGVLSLIDKLEENKDKQKQSSINSEMKAGIEWLHENFKDFGYTQIKSHRTNNGDYFVQETSYKYNWIKINDDGSFVFSYDFKTNSKGHKKRDDSLYTNIECKFEILLSGSFKDVGIVKLEKNKEIHDVYRISADEKDNKFLFYEKSLVTNRTWNEGKGEDVSTETTSQNDSGFTINLDNLGLAERMKNCFELIAGYYREKKYKF